jgi:hypothetical protein
MTEDEIRKQIEFMIYGGLINTDTELRIADSINCQLTENKKLIIIDTNECNTLNLKYTKQQFGWIIRQLQKLHEKMDE